MRPSTHALEELLQNRLKPYWGEPLLTWSGKELHGHKGWAGECLEEILGVSDKHSCGPDFPELGVELKTLPLSSKFQVLESTFLSKISLPFQEGCFLQSRLFRKIRRIFWVPLIGDKGTPLSERRIGQGFLWELAEPALSIFEQDWDELTALLRQGLFSQISAHLGAALHIRPKAAHSRDKVRLKIGEHHTTLVPLGFYLRRSFTQQIICERFAIP